MTDHRIEAVTLALHGGAGRPAGEDPADRPTGTRGDGVRALSREDATIILAAADAADAAQHIHRVKVDDDTVNLVAQTLGEIQNRGDAFQVSHYLRAAHEVLEALTGAPSAHGRDAPGADA